MPRGTRNGKVGRPIDENTPERAREIRQMGGKKSQEVQRKKKLIRETLEELLSLPLKDPNVKKKLKSIGIDTPEMTQQTLMALGIVKSAQQGDARAATWVRDSMGQKEADKLDIIKPVQIIIEDDYGDDSN